MLLPITREKQLKGRNAYNRGGYVVMDPDAKPYAAIWAQECYEAMYKLNPVNSIPMLFSNEPKREMEILSHEIEVQVAGWLYGKNMEQYRWVEAQRMVRGYESLFSKYAVDSLVRMMKYKTYFAKKWISKHEKAIKRMMK